MVWRPRDGRWDVGRNHPRGQPVGLDPLLAGGFRLLDGTTFGQAGWNVGVEHGRYHGAGNGLGSGCAQIQAPSSFRCDVQAGVTRTQTVPVATTMRIDQFRIGLVPYTSGLIRMTLRPVGGAPIVSCLAGIDGFRHTPDEETYIYVRSRQFGCEFPPVTVEGGRTYEFVVSAESGAQASVLALGDATVWPYQPQPPMADLPGASTPGRMGGADDPIVEWDLQYAWRIAG